MEGLQSGICVRHIFDSSKARFWTRALLPLKICTEGTKLRVDESEKLTNQHWTTKRLHSRLP